ncbi:MAG: UDP-N-acetylmuramoyl-tripeptide--D-alanyl-D-alanine ligase, partial [Pseudomonadota bacterium]
MWNIEDIIKATSGKTNLKNLEINSVSIDSRTIIEGALFIALKGDNFDGADYVNDAIAKGAVAVITSSKKRGNKEILVDDTYQALLDIANFARKRTSAKIIGVTGSVGKTGTKDAIKTALKASGKVYATKGNLNNHIGLPLSLANMPRDTDFGVFELGMNHAGEISFLTKIAQPDIAIITTVEAVHLEFFKDVAGIADAKAEIMEGLSKNGTIILNHDNTYYKRLKN